MTGIIFLDCDGVLCNARSQLYDFEDGDNTLVYHPSIPPLERRCIASLQQIVESTGAQIVLTTTWRQIPENRTFLIESLAAAGCVVVGDTPALSSCSRGEEIAAWLQDHAETTHFVIIEDDDKHVASFQKDLPAGTWVQTVMRHETDPLLEGLTDDKASCAIAILEEGEAAAIRKRIKFDPATGDFLRFPGVTVVSNLSGSDEGALAQLALILQAQPILGSCFTLLPPASYHATLLDINCQYKLGLTDKAFGKLLQGPQWSCAAEEIIAAHCVPGLATKPGGLLVSKSVIGMELIPVDEGTPAHPKDLPIFQKLARDLNISVQKHPWHFTLAYCHLPNEFEAADPDRVDAERIAVERAFCALCPLGSAVLPFEPARLCHFEDMTCFTPWDGTTLPPKSARACA